jgi:TetR/AcrR family transcriptional regulator, transcriptional repressor of bet genes
MMSQRHGLPDLFMNIVRIVAPEAILQDKLAAVSSERHEANPVDPAAAGGGRALRMRQRQRLIDACISALHLYGPSRTTVEKVVAIADLSPGIVRFYFDSKDAMLVASLAHLAAEFEQCVLEPVARLKDSPVRALEQLVELYFDPEIASSRKVSVWYSFWGEASSRQEYQDICGKKDEDFAVLVRELIGALIARTGAPHLDADAISLGLIGVLEVLWQGIAFQSESGIDRGAARSRSLAYLGSVFPGMFPSAAQRTAHRSDSPAIRPVPPRKQGAALPAWAYGSAALLEIERDELFRPSWQMVGHVEELAEAGDYLAASWPWERALILRGAHGELHALRNACPRQPHALLDGRSGHVAGKLHCAAHALTYDLAGRHLSGATPGSLTALELLRHGPLLLVRSVGPRASAEAMGSVRGWPKLVPGRRETLLAAADWKLIVEQWLEEQSVRQVFLPPNQLLDLGCEPPRLLQVVPEAPGRSRLVLYALGPTRPAARRGRAREGESLQQRIALAESTQSGLEALPMQPRAAAAAGSALAAFRESVAALLPLAATGRGTGG